jgi:hypothetical protein
MHKLMFSVICSALVLIASLGTASDAVAAQDSVFDGTWTSTDLDGSNQSLSVSGSGQGALAMFLFDDAATNACGGRPARLVGTGVPDGDSLVMSGTLTCVPGGNVLRFRISFGFEYSPATDTLTDESGVTWNRA